MSYYFPVATLMNNMPDADEVRSVLARRENNLVKHTLSTLCDSCHDHQLPLTCKVHQAEMGANKRVLYECLVENVFSDRAWTVKYHYSDFLALKHAVDQEATCDYTKCTGSCHAIRQFLAACFPPKRLFNNWFSSSRAMQKRQQQLQSVLTHLLRCCLLPGSAMKCIHARHNLPQVVFEFLQVQNENDRRPLLHILLDRKQQGGNSSSQSTCASKCCDADCECSDCHECAICFDEIDQCPRSGSCSSSDTFDSEEEEIPAAASSVELPCGHVFHRGCVFEWLLFESNCPLCRAQVCPSAKKNLYSVKGRVQWWLDAFDKDELLCA